MKKVVSFKINSVDNINLAKSIWNNLKNGWQKDLEIQNAAHTNTEIEPSYFFTLKEIDGITYSLCINAYNNKITTTVIRNRDKDHIPLTINEWNSTLDTFVQDHSLENIVGFEWVKLDYIG